MNIEFIKNSKTGILEAWEDGRVIGEFVTTGKLVKCKRKQRKSQVNRTLAIEKKGEI